MRTAGSRGVLLAVFAAAALLALGLPLSAYIGPGAGFAFLSSFLVLFLTFFLALFSFLSWPFRLLWRLVRGEKACVRLKPRKKCGCCSRSRPPAMPLSPPTRK